MKTNGREGGRTVCWLNFEDRGIGWRRAGAMLSVSLLLHATLFGLAALFRFAPVVVEEEAGNGDAPDDGFVDLEPEAAIEPPAEIAVVEPPPSTDFVEVQPEPAPIPTDPPRTIVATRPVPSSAPRSHGIRGPARGTAPVQGGNSLAGWSTPKPTYPFEARRLRRQGSGGVRVTTNGSGRVVSAEMLPGIDPLLDAVAVNFARSAWTGPPNATRVVAITFALE